MSEPSFRDSSRGHWLSNTSTDHVNAGSLQRIADATEKMATNWVSITADRDQLKRRCDYLKSETDRLARRISALRGVVTRMRKARGR